MYQPDGIARFSVDGTDYVISANEGDARDYDGLAEKERIKDLDLDPLAFPEADELQADENLGRLNVTTTLGDDDDDDDCLERMGGIVVFDLSDPAAPAFVLYDNSTRDFGGDPELGTAGDLGPEGLEVVVPEDSPSGKPLLVVANEISGTVRVYEIQAE